MPSMQKDSITRNDTPPIEVAIVLRAKANHEKFTKEEKDWLRFAARTIEMLVDQQQPQDPR